MQYISDIDSLMYTFLSLDVYESFIHSLIISKIIFEHLLTNEKYNQEQSTKHEHTKTFDDLRSQDSCAKTMNKVYMLK